MFRNDRQVYRRNPYSLQKVVEEVLSSAHTSPSPSSTLSGGDSPRSEAAQSMASSAASAPAPPCALGEENDHCSFSASSSTTGGCTDDEVAIQLPLPPQHSNRFVGQQPILGFSFPERSSAQGRGGQTALIHVSYQYAPAVLHLNRCGFLNDQGNRTHQARNPAAQAALDCYSHWARARSVNGDPSRRGNRCPNHAMTIEPSGGGARTGRNNNSNSNPTRDFYRFDDAIRMSFEEFLHSEPKLAHVPRRDGFLPNQPYLADPNATFHEASFLAVYDRVFGLDEMVGGIGGITTHDFDGESIPAALDYQNFMVPHVPQYQVGALLQGGTRGVTLFVGQMDPAKFQVTVSLMNQALALGSGAPHSTTTH